MIKISTQRNDHKDRTDLVSYTPGNLTEAVTVNINGQEFVFRQGVDLVFEAPHEQIIDPKRDDNGIFHATIIKQYTGVDKSIFETCDADGHYGGCECDSQEMMKTIAARSKPIKAEIKKEDLVKINHQLLINKEQEVAKLKELYLDADLEDDQELKISLKAQIKNAKVELSAIQEALAQEEAKVNN